RKAFDWAVLVQKLRCGLCSNARNTGISISRIAHQREKIWNKRRINPKLLPDPSGVTNDLAPLIDLHHTRPAHALSQILVRRPNSDFFHSSIFGREMSGRSEGIIGFEFNHRPHDNSHCCQRLLEWMELSQQCTLNARTSLIVRPKIIAKRLDYVISRNAKMRLAALKHLKHALQHTDHRAIRRVHPFIEPSQSVEMTEEFVGAVDEVNHHLPEGL